MAKITIKKLESLTVNDARQILRENGNLAGRISVRKDGISVSFFYRYRWGDQNKEYACGTWPRKSLTDIRKARNQARALIDEQNGKISIWTGRECADDIDARGEEVEPQALPDVLGRAGPVVP